MLFEKIASRQLNSQRNSGIDLLRIITMYMVIVLHVLGSGGVLESAPASSLHYWILWFLEIAAFGAVDIFALISGFVGYKAKHKYTNIAVLWIQVALYSVVFTAANKIFYDSSIGKRDLLFSFFPVTQGKTWYFTMYFALFFLMPVLNAAMEAMTEKAARSVIIAGIVLFSVLPFIWVNDPFITNGGYSLLWLIVLYFLGAYIGKYHVFGKLKRYQALIGYVACVTAAWAAKLLLQDHFTSFMGIVNHSGWLVHYMSPPILGSAVFLLFFFRDLRLPDAAKKIIAVCAPLTFGVYVIHLQPFINDHYILDRFKSFSSYSPFVMTVSVLGAAAVIYIACSLIDFVRARLFDLLKLKGRLLALEEKIRALRS